MEKHWGCGIYLLFIILSFAITTKTCHATVDCFANERVALLQFKHSLTDSSGMLSSWVGKNCCRWERVGCDGNTGHVVKLDLRADYPDFKLPNRISLFRESCYLVGGELNSALAELKHLTHLDLSWNDFGGSKIPSFIGSLKKLRYLNLSTASFNGMIPHHLGNLSNLKVLDLSFNNNGLISDNVAWVSRLSSLQYLDLTNVDLGGAQNIGKLLSVIPSLTEVRLSRCSLSNIHLPPLLLNSTCIHSKIQNLYLGANSFHGPLPPFLRNMTSLELLDLSSYNLHDQPQSFGNLLNMFPSLSELHLPASRLLNTHLSPTHLNFSTPSKIQLLDLSYNLFDGEFPSLLTNMSSLRILDLSGNKMNSSIPVIKNLEQLNIASNEFQHFEQTGIWNQCHLKWLDLASNYFHEEMIGPSANVSKCRQFDLEVLDLSRNGFTGSIPESLGRLIALKVLNLESNKLIGPIPTSIGKLTELEELYLKSNHLTGPIPIWLGQLTKLAFFDVSSNSLGGLVFETHFANLSRLEALFATSNPMLTFNISLEWIPPFQLRYLHLGSCKIASEFPQWIQTQKKLKELVLSNASISGPLPRWLEDIPNISQLDLSHNFISGPLKNLSSQLSLLFLQNNLFNGSIPESFCKLTSIKFLDLSRNRLSGELPQCLEKLQYLVGMILSSNRLSGLIPSMSSSELTWLQLNNNSFHGELPPSLGVCRNLGILDLGENKFFGRIPKWLGENVTVLRVLRLHENNFSGSIPKKLCRNSNLQVLDFAHNRLTGAIPRCFGEFVGMVTPDFDLFPDFSYLFGLEQSMREVFQGVVLEYTKNMQYVVNMDLSSNDLVGEIPKELTSLERLIGLNLSHNYLSGTIPDRIGDMKSLISLDLSVNKLSGTIPSSVAALTSLSHLNLSYNDLSGRIPTGSQLQTLIDPTIYAGNGQLCGPPLPKNCSNDEVSVTSNNIEKDKAGDEPKKVWFYLDITSGFATGFWGVIGVLLFKKRWRQLLFRSVEVSVDKIYVAIAVRVSTMKRGRGTI